MEIPGYEIVPTTELLAVYRLLLDVAAEEIEPLDDDDPVLAKIQEGVTWLTAEIERMEWKLQTSTSPVTSTERSSPEEASP